MRNSKLMKITVVLSRIIEVVCWCGACLTALAGVILTIFRGKVVEAYENGMVTASNISVDGSVNAAPEEVISAIANGGSLLIFIPLAVLCVLTALIFRNICIVFKNSENESPFSDANVKRIRDIGYFAIAIPVCKIISTLLFYFAIGTGDYALSVEMSEIVFGLVALCLSQYFAYGAKLQKDVDGLV